MELLDGYKGKTTMGELMTLDIGTIDYMYYKMYLKYSTKAGRDQMKAERMEDSIDDFT